MEYYSNMCRYNAKGQRVAVFGKIDGTQLNISVITCSKKDQFSRKEAHRMYQEYINGNLKQEPVAHPLTITHNMENPAMPKKEFLTWVNRNYYRVMRDHFFVKGTVIKTVIEEYEGKYGGRIIVKHLAK